LAGLHVVITPAWSCSGIEENRDDGKIDPRPCGFGCVGAGRDEGGAVNPAGREVAPTAMMGDSKIRIASSGHIDDAADSVVEPIRDEPEISRLAAPDRFRYDLATGAHSASTQQRCRLTRRGHDPSCGLARPDRVFAKARNIRQLFLPRFRQQHRAAPAHPGSQAARPPRSPAPRAHRA